LTKKKRNLFRLLRGSPAYRGACQRKTINHAIDELRVLPGGISPNRGGELVKGEAGTIAAGKVLMGLKVFR